MSITDSPLWCLWCVKLWQSKRI